MFQINNAGREYKTGQPFFFYAAAVEVGETEVTGGATGSKQHAANKSKAQLPQYIRTVCSPLPDCWVLGFKDPHLMMHIHLSGASNRIIMHITAISNCSVSTQRQPVGHKVFKVRSHAGISI